MARKPRAPKFEIPTVSAPLSDTPEVADDDDTPQDAADDDDALEDVDAAAEADDDVDADEDLDHDAAQDSGAAETLSHCEKHQTSWSAPLGLGCPDCHDEAAAVVAEEPGHERVWYANYARKNSRYLGCELRHEIPGTPPSHPVGHWTQRFHDKSELVIVTGRSTESEKDARFAALRLLSH